MGVWVGAQENQTTTQLKTGPELRFMEVLYPDTNLLLVAKSQQLGWDE